MRTIIFTSDYEYGLHLVEHNELLGVTVSQHLLYKKENIDYLFTKIDLLKYSNKEIVIIVYYESKEMLEYAKEQLKDVGYDLVVYD